MERFLSSTLWPEIKRAARSADRVHAAIAYVHDIGHLPLGRGDVLVCDATPESIASGHTSVRVLRRLAKKRVRLFSAPGLHAKVLVADAIVFCGSGNASRTSISQSLVEAGIMSSSPATVASALSFVRQLIESSATTELTDERLRVLSRIKVTRRPFSGDRPRRRSNSSPSIGEPSAWIVSTTALSDDDYPDEATQIAAAEKQIKRDFSIVDPNWVRCSGNDRFQTVAHGGSRLIVMSRPAGRRNAVPSEVTPPSPLLFRQDAPDGRWTRFYYGPSLDSSLRALDWPTFLSVVRRAKVPRTVKKTSVISLSAADMDEVSRLWPRKRRRRKR